MIDTIRSITTNTDVDYKDLKNGDVIVITNRNCIAIVNKVETNEYGLLELYTYAELHNTTIFFEKNDPSCSNLLEDIQFRPATEEDKYTLYNTIGKYFTEEYDKDWYNHFTDSSWFDIQDFLFDVFCIKVEEYDDDMLYPKFIDDIQLYIWNRLCKSMGYKDYDGDEFVEQLVNKQEFIDKVCNYLENINTDTYMDSGIFQMYDLIKDLRKTLE